MNLQINKYRLNALTKIDKIILILLFVFLSLPLSLAYAEENIAFIKKDDKRYKELSNKFKNCDEFLDVTWFKTDDPYMGYIREKRYISQEDPHNDDVFYNGEIFTSSLFVIDNYYLRDYNICSNIGKFYAENYEYKDLDYMDTDCSRFDMDISGGFSAFVSFNTDMNGLRKFIDDSKMIYDDSFGYIDILKYSGFKDFGLDGNSTKMSFLAKKSSYAFLGTYTYSKNTKTVCMALPDNQYSMILELKDKNRLSIDFDLINGNYTSAIRMEVALDINLDGKDDILQSFNNNIKLKSYSVDDKYYETTYENSTYICNISSRFCEKRTDECLNCVLFKKSVYPPYGQKCSTISTGTLLTDGKYYYDTLPTCNLYELTGKGKQQ